MKAVIHSHRFSIAVATILLAACSVDCGESPSRRAAKPETQLPSSENKAPPQRVREAAVAGLFYPKEPSQLSRVVDQLVKLADEHDVADLKALICPHAGYTYSGPVAAQAYKTLLGREFDTVIILAASHYAAFEGIAVPDVDAYRTPLGLVPISDKAKALAKERPFAVRPKAVVQRPSWWRQASCPAPEPGEDRPETWEHSIEVQLPFLQTTLKRFTVLPLLFGEVDPRQAADVLARHLDGRTLIIASSDLSHYHPYEAARGLDKACLDAICKLDAGRMSAQEACGKVPILTLMHLARTKGWRARLLDYRNSGDTSGDKSGVVGYPAVAVHAPGPEHFSAAERRQLLELARRTLRDVVVSRSQPQIKEADLPAKFLEPGRCFVTLTKAGALRGCIGNLVPRGSLWHAIMSNAESAALRDFRFPPVEPRDLDDLQIEISVLTDPKPLPFTSPEDLLRQLQPHQDGVVLKIGPASATYLPQVWSKIPDKVEFLDSLAQKAGCDAKDWRGPGVSISTYRVESFSERGD